MQLQLFFKVFFTYKYIKIIFFIFKKFIFDTNTSKYLKIQIKKSKIFSLSSEMFRAQFLNLTWSKARVPGFDRVTGSSESILFLKSKRRCFSKKKKSQQVATGFLTGFCRVNLSGQPSFSFPQFFLNSARFQLRVDPLGLAKFQNYGLGDL